MNNWRTCNHEWGQKQPGDYFANKTSYRYFCPKCEVYSYAGPMYDLLKDKRKSVFLFGKQMEPTITKSGGEA